MGKTFVHTLLTLGLRNRWPIDSLVRKDETSMVVLLKENKKGRETERKEPEGPSVHS